METKINYQTIFEKTIAELQQKNEKPKLLLHACCGCCFTQPYEELKDYFDVTIFYCNSNIYPKEEYDHRVSEFERYVKEINANVPFVFAPYDNDKFNEILDPYGPMREGGERCKACFLNRYEPAFIYASEHGFDYVGTVMTISRFKNSQVINKLGEELEKKYPTIKWLYADFKKNNGFEKSLELVRKHHLYYQLYCGCKFSYQEYLNRIGQN